MSSSLLIVLLMISFALNSFSITLDEFLLSKEGDIGVRKQKIEYEYELFVASGEGASCDDIINTCGAAENPNINLINDTAFGKAVSREKMVTLYQGDFNGKGKDEALVCAAKTLQDLFKEGLLNNIDTKWQYFSDQPYGTHNVYPGADRGCPTSYDPRFRPWFATAASGPKDVILIIDSSGSMSNYDRMELTKKGAKKVLKTLTFSDYIQIVEFDSDTRLATTLDSKKLHRATDDTKKKLIDFIDGMVASGGTNMEKALKTSFSLIDKSREAGATSGCQIAILFLTDGELSEGRPPSEVAEEWNSDLDRNVRVFTFSFGKSADKEQMRKLSCENKGIWNHVDDGGDLGSAMSKYYTLYSVGLSSDRSEVRWSEPYIDASGLGEIITGASPCFDRTLKPPSFFGVTAIDFSTSLIYNQTGVNPQELYDNLLKRSQLTCATVNIDECTLERLRGEVHKCNSCDPFAWWIVGVILGVIFVGSIIVVSFGYKKRKRDNINSESDPSPPKNINDNWENRASSNVASTNSYASSYPTAPQPVASSTSPPEYDVDNKNAASQSSRIYSF